VFGRLKRAVSGGVSSVSNSVTGMTEGVISVIEWRDFDPRVVVKRFPEDGPADIKFGTQLIVRPNQTAVFMRGGQVLDTFGAGTHTLETANLPLMTDAIKHVTGGHNIFSAEVFFVNQMVIDGLKWGTPEPLSLKDDELGWVQVRAHGEFKVRITDPKVFVNEVVGGRRMFSGQEVRNFLISAVKQKITDLVATTFKSFGTILANTDELASAMKLKLREDFGKYGIELQDFFITMSVPEEIQEAMKIRARMGVMGAQGMAMFQQEQAALAMRDMAKNPGTGGAMASAGMGMGMGMMFPQMMQQSMGGGGYPQQGGYPGYPPPPPHGYPGYPPPGYPPQGGGYPPQGGGYPPQGGGYPPQGQQGYPPQGQGHPPQGPQGHGAPPEAPVDPTQAKIAKLRELVEMGVLSQEEFDAKAALLTS
jgi:membrane protease subunit (stomatin/prohibitin family)